MKEQDALFKIVGSGLRVLAGGIQAVAEKIDGLAGARQEGQEMPDSGPVGRPTEKSRPHSTTIRVTPAPSETRQAKSATDVVLAVIEASGDKVDVDRLMQETGFERRKIHNALYRLKNQGKIRNVEKGVYEKC